MNANRAAGIAAGAARDIANNSLTSHFHPLPRHWAFLFESSKLESRARASVKLPGACGRVATQLQQDWSQSDRGPWRLGDHAIGERDRVRAAQSHAKQQPTLPRRVMPKPTTDPRLIDTLPSMWLNRLVQNRFGPHYCCCTFGKYISKRSKPIASLIFLPWADVGPREWEA